MKRFALHLASLLIVTVTAAVAHADLTTTYFDSGRFGYTGSWTRYATFSDAQMAINPTETGSMPQRDIGFYISQGITENTPYDPSFIVLTRWYDPDSGNPSNTNEGFFQYYDDNASTVTSLFSTWNESLTSFTLQAHAENANYADDFARFGERAGGPGTDTEGFFHVLDIDLIASGLVGAFNAMTGRYEGTDTGAVDISGSITGIVENVGTDPTRNGFYAFTLTLNNTSWAFDNGHVMTGDTYAFSVNAVPESELTVMLLFALIPAGYVIQRRRARLAMTPAMAV